MESQAQAQEETRVRLQSFAGPSRNEQSYFQTHLTRYLGTLELLPRAEGRQAALELGAAYHHLTPLLLDKGYAEVHCTDVWEGAACTRRQVTSHTTGATYEFPVSNCDAERAPWPYHDGQFDLVLCAEVLEHLVHDPMCMVAEANRVLKPEGLLLLTTPNIASAKSVLSVLQGKSPYVYGKYERGGRATDRHNREYTPGEVVRLLGAGGFAVVELRTQDSWWTGYEAALPILQQLAMPTELRGDNILCLARKHSAVQDRHPVEFYLSLGIQSTRRVQQGSRLV